MIDKIFLYVLPLYIAILIIIVKYITEKIITKPRLNIGFESMLTILNIIVRSELDLYDRTIFLTKGHITNSNYENFYKDICNHIFKCIPNTFMNELSLYITQEAIAEIVCESVQKYLQSKIGSYERKQDES